MNRIEVPVKYYDKGSAGCLVHILVRRSCNEHTQFVSLHVVAFLNILRIFQKVGIW
jgi:hypothetical protein